MEASAMQKPCAYSICQRHFANRPETQKVNHDPPQRARATYTARYVRFEAVKMERFLKHDPQDAVFCQTCMQFQDTFVSGYYATFPMNSGRYARSSHALAATASTMSTYINAIVIAASGSLNSE